ncbi:hypothetical protein HHK36_006677 [Tetracentron sinense]|uniref:Rhodanese domain-containing protein n=1 Tax=Tetracentron sinense TaxID=13715 RepID=A0A834ZLY5_TETSI|nr:hypothetical protein HHK36_006677 [Tetracentron sinense]
MDATKSSEDIVTIGVHAAKGLLSSGHRYVDVRTIDDFNKGHVDNALNVPYYLSVTKEELNTISAMLVSSESKVVIMENNPNRSNGDNLKCYLQNLETFDCNISTAAVHLETSSPR